MSKYIEVEKLIKSIGNYQEGAKAALNPIDGDADYYKGKIDACEDIEGFIVSLQQEQPEVDLEKEIFEAEKKYGDINEMGGYQILLFDDEFRDILRHFYELGLNARKED